jgi:hypothetical protein
LGEVEFAGSFGEATSLDNRCKRKQLASLKDIERESLVVPFFMTALNVLRLF